LRRWDSGDTVWSIEMGGLGPGYEQAIQVLAMEIIRDEIDNGIPEESKWRSWGDSTVTRINDSCGGFSGAQVGAAKQIAYRFIKEGPSEALKDVERERRIQISKA
jgi:hypothetical protein